MFEKHITDYYLCSLLFYNHYRIKEILYKKYWLFNYYFQINGVGRKKYTVVRRNFIISKKTACFFTSNRYVLVVRVHLFVIHILGHFKR